MKTLLHIACLLSATMVFAQTEPEKPVGPWERDLQFGLNANQSSFSDNWKAGGVNSSAITGFLNAKANYKKGNHTWTNDMQLQYGNTRLQGDGLRKNADRIFAETKYGYQISKSWNLFASANFISQFDAGFEYFDTGSVPLRRISGFMAPAYLTEALGVEYKPVPYFYAQLGVGALRQTFVLDQSLYDKYAPTEEKYNLLYGVERGQNMRNQVVFQFVANFDKEIYKNIVLRARYQSTADYQNLTSTGIVHRFDGSIVAKITKYITVNFTTALLYDYDQDKDIQYSQVLSVGLLYRITNMKE